MTAPAIDSLEWDDPDKYYSLDFAVSKLAERAIEFEVEALMILPESDAAGYAKYFPAYGHVLPILINNKDRYLCLFRPKPGSKTEAELPPMPPPPPPPTYTYVPPQQPPLLPKPT